MPRLDLFLISALILFLELTCIRWLPAHVLFLSFFTNTVLLACFVGMSIGCLTARKPGREINRTPFWLLLTVAAGLFVLGFRNSLERHTNVGNQTQPEVIFFGTEMSALKQVSFTVPVEVVAGMFFLLAGAVLVGPGQELGRAFTRVPNRTTAYALDLLGSLCGIGVFALCSELRLPPVVWFGVVSVGLMYFLVKGGRGKAEGGEDNSAFRIPHSAFQPLALLATVALTTITSGLWTRGTEGNRTIWSPYYRVDYEPGKRFITTNLISHQVMHPRAIPTHALYDQPYVFQKATGRPEFRRILIIGAGSGNDLARALYWAPPDAKIDAVEIDPVIQSIGKADHPDRPYQDPRVTPHLNDGRNFLRRAPDGEYDLVIFALVDSLVLQSGYSNIRLESYLFTKESFADVARVLKPDGQAVVYNFFRQGWLVARIRDELRSAFGADPLILTSAVVDMDTEPDLLPLDGTLLATGGFTAVFAGREAAIGPLRAAFAANGNTYWAPRRAAITRDITGNFGPTAPPQPPPATNPAADTPAVDLMPPGQKSDWVPLRPARVADAGADLLPATDDWPFLYVRRPTVPDLTWRGIVLTVILSAGLWWGFRERRGGESEKHRGGEEEKRRGGEENPADTSLLARSFLLGAGFMLIETRAVVQMALLFGSTWTVNTVVFAAVLVMALIGNLYAGWVKPRQLGFYYVGLFAALAANLLIPPDVFLGMDRTAQTVAACGLAFAPILFAGVIFPVSFNRAPQPDRFFGANVAGALAGGLAENLSMLVGFRWLLAVAVGLYALSALFGSRSSDTSSAGNGV